MLSTTIGMSNATAFIERSYQQCLPKQWVREVFKNGQEADATRIEFGLEWQGVVNELVYRRKVSDNGYGMSAEQLSTYFKTIGDSGKTSGFDPDVPDSAIHGNFGIGCRVALLPWNHEGVVYISYQKGKGSMLWMFFDKEKNAYSIKNWSIADKNGDVEEVIEVIDVDSVSWSDVDAIHSYGIDWSTVAPEWIKEHGTCIVLLGRDRRHDTFISSDYDTETNETRAITKYINTRFYDLSAIDVKSLEFNFSRDKRDCWPTSELGECGFSSRIGGKDNTSRGTTRTCHGAKYYFTEPSKHSTVISGENLIEDNRVKINWFYRERDPECADKINDLPQNTGYSPGSSFIGLKYKDELFKISDNVLSFRNFGICHKSLRERIVIIVEPQLYSSQKQWGIFPDSQRNRICFTGNGERCVDPPIRIWGNEFASVLPEEIRKYLAQMQNEEGIGFNDEEVYKKLRERFGIRWKDTITMQGKSKKSKLGNIVKGNVFVQDPDGEHNVELSPFGDDLLGTEIIDKEPRPPKPEPEDEDRPKPEPEDKPIRPHIFSGGEKNKNKNKPALLFKRTELSDTGNIESREVNVNHGLPNCHCENKEEFDEDKQSWIILSYTPNYQGKQEPALLLNVDSSFIRRNVEYYQQKYNENYHEEVAKVVIDSWRFVFSARLAHSLELKKVLNRTRLEDTFYTDEALTYSCYGLVADDMFISSRLGHIKKNGKESCI